MWSTADGDEEEEDEEEEDDDLFSSGAPGLRSSPSSLIPAIKAVISQDNRGREIAARVQVTSSPAMNPREARRRLEPPRNRYGRARLSSDGGTVRSCVKTRAP